MQFLTPKRLHKINPLAVLELVETAYGYQPGTLLRRSNTRRLAHPRHLATFLLIGAGMGYSEVGRFLRKHHVTVIHSCRFIEKAAAEDPEVAELVAELRSKMANDPDQFEFPARRLMSVLHKRSRIQYHARETLKVG